MASPNSRTALKARLYEIIFGTETPAGRLFDLILIYTILASVLAVILDSVQIIPEQYDLYFYYAEWVFTLLFTAEYAARLYCSPSPWRYARSFYGVVDLVSILPTYLAFFIYNAQYLLVIRLLRVLRIFRILKLVRYLGEANVLARSIMAARRKIFVFLFSMMVLTTIFGCLMYIIEGPANGFTSIPKSMYWAIVTITTVGYGDITPKTPLGQAIASLVVITGYSVIAVPTGILTAELATEIQRDRAERLCRHCQRAGHDADAYHCKFCGGAL